MNQHWNICRYEEVTISATTRILAFMSLLTLAAISVDRLLALMLGLRYKQVVTLKRTRYIIISFWVLSTGVAVMRLFYNFSITLRYEAIVISLCIVTSIVSHTKISLTLRRRQSQVQDHVQQPNQTNQLNIARFRKAVSTALWLQFALIVCNLPRVISDIFFTKTGLSSSLNPILYCWKIDEVRLAMKETIREVLCC